MSYQKKNARLIHVFETSCSEVAMSKKIMVLLTLLLSKLLSAQVPTLRLDEISQEELMVFFEKLEKAPSNKTKKMVLKKILQQSIHKIQLSLEQNPLSSNEFNALIIQKNHFLDLQRTLELTTNHKNLDSIIQSLKQTSKQTNGGIRILCTIGCLALLSALSHCFKNEALIESELNFKIKKDSLETNNQYENYKPKKSTTFKEI